MKRMKFWIGGAVAVLAVDAASPWPARARTTSTPSATFSAAAKRVDTRRTARAATARTRSRTAATRARSPARTRP